MTGFSTVQAAAAYIEACKPTGYLALKSPKVKLEQVLIPGELKKAEHRIEVLGDINRGDGGKDGQDFATVSLLPSSCSAI